MNTHLDAALAYAAAGLAPIPVKCDGTKQPATSWRQFQHDSPRTDIIENWWTNNPSWGVGIICGAASGGLEMLELEGRAAHRATDLLGHIRAAGEHTIADALAKTWTVISPSGGLHWHYRVTGIDLPGNTRLAWTKAGDTFEVGAETRGQGGYTVAPPSGGTIHATGKSWTTIKGSHDQIAELTADQRATLHRLTEELLNEKIDQPHTAPATPPTTARDTTGMPGQAIDGALSWHDILAPHGWQIHHRGTGGEIHWTRPGKHLRDGVSATTGHADDRDRLYVFSSSVPDFNPETPYTKFAAYAILNHRGDYSAASKNLIAQGIGEIIAPSDSITVGFPTGDTRQTSAEVDTGTTGALATVHSIGHATTAKRSDDYNALQLVARFGDRLRYVTDRGRWMCWKGDRWKIQDDAAAGPREYAKIIGRELPDTDKEDQAHRRKSLSANGISNMLIQARTHETIAVTLDQLDANAYQLCTPAGTVDLRSGDLGAPTPADLCTKITRTSPDPHCPTPLWNEFLATTFAGQDPLIVPYLQRLLGDSIVGRVKHHVLPFLHGAGANGKSTLMDTMLHILGDYAGSAPAGFLMAGMQQHETEIARLSGLRFVVASEVNERDRFDEAKVKMLTGGDTLTARFMRQDHFTFNPTHSLWLMGNSQPRVGTGGTSFWRRLRLINFANVIDENKRIPDLGQRLIEEEAPGILAWLIDGARLSIADGIDTPNSVRASTQDYAQEEDALSQFADECLVFSPGLDAPTSKVITAYRNWCDANGERPMSSQMLGRELRSRFDVGIRKTNGAKYYTKLSLSSTDDDPGGDGYATGF